jgi:exo-beta-1,3-glucanase (GH17 family)
MPPFCNAFSAILLKRSIFIGRMKFKKYSFLLIISFSLSFVSQTKKINGLSFVASSDSISSHHVHPVLRTNSNFVALMPYGYIRELTTPEITYKNNWQWFGETKKGLLQYAKRFQGEKIRIMVKPHIWVSKGSYTGNIEMENEEDWTLLEDSYRTYILYYAKAAAELEAEIFCIGTELAKFVAKRPEYWRQLIQEIRLLYKGKLTYAANWDEFKRVSFWSDLDFIGIDAYFPLSDKRTPTVAEYELGWSEHKQQIIKVQKQFKKPVIFAEFGYRSVDFNGERPWDSADIEATINLQAQVNALQAIYNQFWNERWFAGGFIWKWFHNHTAVGGEKNNRFTPQNKPAEELIKKLYGL